MPHHHEWTWMAGSSTAGATPVYGAQGVAAAGNTPASAGVTGRDSTGRIWLYANTNVWRYDPVSGHWSWMNGGGATAPAANWGTKGVEAPTNHPGARALPITAWDLNGRLWLYGGARADINGQMGDLNDLWRYDSATNQWTWITGGNVRFSFSGTYGMRNVAAATNHPGARNSAAAAMDAQGRFLFFGGNGQAPMADLWRYDPATNWWTWLGGSSSSLAVGAYGTQGVPSTSNRIGSRRHGTTMWSREDGTVWLFGGYGFDSNPSMFEMPQNDLWRFQPATNEWTWMAGSSLGNYTTNMNGWRGTYGTQGAEGAANTPGSRVHAASWVDAYGQLWLMGGTGLDEVEPQSTGLLNDVWRFSPLTGKWSWMAGSNLRGHAAVFGSQGVAAAANTPAARQFTTYGVSAWYDPSGSLRLIGGGGSADQWRFELPVAQEIRVTRGIADVLDGGTFAVTDAPSGGTSQTVLTLTNTGTAALTSLAASLSGTHGAEYSLSGPAVTTLAAGESTTITISFTPAAAGQRTASLTITSNDADENPYDIALSGIYGVPEIALEQPVGTNLTDNSGSISLPTTNVGSSAATTFTIRNLGTGDLTGISITKDGAHAGDFSVSTPSASIAPGSSATFTATFSPTLSGTRTAAIHIASNDADENPFDIALTGTANGPEISVEYPTSTVLTDGVSSVMLPTTNVGSSSAAQTFTLRNTGNTLLTGISITKDGANSTEFTVSTPVTSISAGSSATFTVTFSPTGVGGDRTAAIHIASSDFDENPFDIALNTTANAPEIAVEQPVGTGLMDGVSVVNVPSAVLGKTSSSAVFTVRNTGVAALTGLSISIDGTHAPDFVTTQIGTSLAAGATTVFQVSFQPQAAGARLAALHISSNDADEGLFDIQLQATATAGVTGSVDMTFSPVNGYFYEACPQTEDRILLSGTFSSIQGVPQSGSARVLLDGTLDTAFNIGSNSGIFAYAAQTDGKVIVGGTFTSMKGTPRNRIARLNADGSLDTGFNPDANASVNYLGIQPDGKILIGGEFTMVGGLTRNYLARLNPDGTVDPAFNPNAGGRIRVMEYLPGGDWLVGGEFTTIGGLPRTYLARIHPDGTVDTSFVPQLDWLVHDVEVQENGMIVIGGYFNTVDGVARSGLARLNPVTGRLDASFTPTPALIIYGMQQQADGKILVVGDYANPPGNPVQRMVRLNADGTEDPSFQVELDQATFSDVHAIRGLNDGRLLILGSFTTVNGLPREGFACLVNDAATDVLTVPSLNQIRWLRGGSTAAVSSVAFEHSSDGGSTWLPVGPGIRVSGGWEINGLNLPVNGLVRALGRTCNGGYRNSSSALFNSQAAYSSAAATPEIVLEQENGAPISDGGTRLFGEQAIQGTKSLSFTLKNTGTLPLTGLSFSIDGVDMGVFTLGGGAPPTELAAGQSRVFTVSFAPQSLRVHTAALHITSNDADEGVYDVTLTGQGTAPDIQVEHPTGTVLTDGGSTVAMNSANLGSSSTRTFTLRNNGIGTLSGISATLSGIHAAEYAITTTPAMEIAQGGSSTLTITFSPAAGGTRTALLSIASNDPDESPFDITLTGSGNAPEIEVEQPVGTVLVDGVSSVGLPPSAVGTASTQSSFTIRNLGIQTLSGITIIKDGTNSADFTISSPGTTISPGGAATFNVTFVPSAVGTRTAAIHITSNDSNESPFDIALTGEGLAPPPGAVDLSFPTEFPYFTASACVQPDGKVLMGGIFSTVLGSSRSNIARLNADQTLDMGFNPGTNGNVRAFAIQPDGKIIAGGSFTQITGATQSYLARLNPNGSLDSVFAPVLNGEVWSVTIQSDGKILIAGGFSIVGGVTRNNLARLNTDGSLDTSFDPNPNGSVFVVRQGLDERLYLGGNFLTIGGLSRNYCARLNMDGSADSSFNASVNSAVVDIAPLGDGKLMIGGYFSSAGGASRSRLARLNANGTADPAFTVGTAGNGNYVLSLLHQADGRVIVCGNFGSIGAFSRIHIGRVNADGTVDAAFNPSSTSAITWSPLLLKNGKMHVFGDFPARGGLVRLVNDPATETLQVLSTSNIRWLRGGSSPEAHAVRFELSTDGGSTWQPLGAGSRRSGGWEIHGLSLPGTGQIRARARYGVSGYQYSSSGEIETITTYSGAVDIPEIALEQPPGTNLDDGGSRDFGSTLVAGTSGLTFTLKNTGNAALTGISVTKDGANASDFMVSPLPSSIAAQSSVTFTVDFTPSALGARSAAIHIASDDEDENPFGISLTGTGISPEIAVEYPTGTSLTDGVSSVTLPATNVGSSSAVQSFTIRNTGTAALTGISITKDGTHSAEFSISTPVTSIAAGANATFTVTFSPTGSGGARTAALHIASSDLDENPFDITINATANAPEIEVEQPAGTALTDDVSTVDFGPVLVGGNAVRTFTIRNAGALSLTSLALSKAGADSANFTLGSLSTTSLASGGSTTFTVTFAPGAVVTRNAVIRVASNDFDENPFEIAVTGVGVVPEIAIEQPEAVNLTDGVSTSTFGSAQIGSNITQSFKVRNTGTAPLTGLALSKAGTNTADFTLGTLAVTTLNPGENTTFDVTFIPTAIGSRSAILRVASSDADENPFDINLGGTGLATEIVVEQPVGTNVSDGGNKSFGSVLLGSSASLTFTIKNIGNLDLTGLSITKDGSNADEFTITAAPTAPVAGPAGSTTFTVQFTPTALGSRSAAIHIANNDADENPFDIQLTGTSTSPEIVVEHPTSNGLQDGVSVVTMSATNVGSVGNITVTLRNTGTATLTGISISKDGDHSGDFGVSTPAAVLNAGSSTTFTVSFMPTALGTRTAALHIASSDLDENPFDIALTATATSPEIEVEQPAGSGLADGVSAVDYGPVNVGSSLVKTYTVRNTGTSSLTSLSLSKAGTNSTLFTVSSLGSATLAVGASTTFTVSYAPNVVGSHSAIIRLASSDLDENPFDIGVTGSGTAPEIAIEQPVGTNLTDNVSSISFPATAAGSSSDPVTFTVRNTGSATLSGLALSKAGTNTADFVLGTLGATSLAPTESTTFTVIFTPTAGGTRTATLRVASNDADENPFDIALSGSATAPTIVVEQPVNFALTSGVSFIDFGELPPGSPIGRTFRIRNTGTAPLSNIVQTKSGANPGDFTVGTPGVTTIAPGAFTTFSVIFNPTDGGYRNATLNIASNATNVSNFSISLVGGGLGPEIRVTTPELGWIIFPQPETVELVDGVSSFAFGSADVGVGSATTRTFTIRNDGLLELTALSLSITGAAAADFSATALTSTPVAVGGTTTFTVSFTPAAVGSRSATLHIASNDYNEASFDFELTGAGLTNLDAWRIQHFGFSLPPFDPFLFGDYEDHQDPDRDGMTNLMEFATGAHPVQNSTPTQSLSQSTGGQLIYTYQRSKDAVTDGVIFTVQHNATLDSAGWSSTGITETILSDNGTIQVIEATIPAPTGSACFTRLRVQRP